MNILDNVDSICMPSIATLEHIEGFIQVVPEENVFERHFAVSKTATTTADFASMFIEGITDFQSHKSIVGTFMPESPEGYSIGINEIRDITASFFDISKIPEDPMKQFGRERKAFEGRISDFMNDYKGKFVAIVKGNLVDSDDDKIKLVKRVYDEYGYIPIYVQKVEKEIPIVKAPTSRIIKRG